MSNKIESLYVHFPFCKHLCNYCDFFKKVPSNSVLEMAHFHSYMEKSMEEHEKLIESNGFSWAPLKTLYIGGGTPSLWGEEGSAFLKKTLEKYSIAIDDKCEFTLEVNPASWSKKSLESWEAIGVNRYSLGIQSLNSEAIKYLDRVHNIDDIHETLSFFSTRKVNFSMDFMLGLPFSEETKRDVIEELEVALTYNPSHFSVYILTVKENYPHYTNLPNEEWIENEYLRVADFLKNRGFNHYEVSSFAKSNCESKHNLNYWKSSTVAALGPSATGFLAEKKLRYKWKTKGPILELEQLDEQAFLLERLYMSMRSSVGLDISLIKDQSSFEQLSKKWMSSGYIQENQQKKIYLTSKGYLLLDSLMSDLFSLNLV